MTQKPRVLIFIVTYNAENHIVGVLDRIPDIFWKPETYDTQVLIIDDASKDNTVTVCHEYKKRTGKPVTILRNPVNQGYGGNQKIGYTYAIENRFDVVVLLHGDGQYPPEKIEDVIAPLLKGEADACFGSRMLRKHDALKGGMPYYKFIANILLTRLQNRLAGTRLSEFHSGFRAYRVEALRAIPFRYNSNDFDFDTDIIIQLAMHRMHIREIPIPTHYGNEICHVNGPRYALQILRTAVLSKLQRYQIYYHPKFDWEEGVTHYPSKVHFDSTHRWAIDQVAPYSTVIDIGLGSGGVAQALVQEKQATIYGYDYVIREEAGRYCKQVFTIDLDTDALTLPQEPRIHYVLLLDVIEHLKDPTAFMTMLRNKIGNQDTTILISTGNIGFFIMRLSLLLGYFNYGKRGILDFTHKRLFTFHSMQRFLTQQGYAVQQVDGIGVPFELMFGPGRVGRAFARLNRVLIKISRGLFSFQIVIAAKPLPTLHHLLEAAERQR